MYRQKALNFFLFMMVLAAGSCAPPNIQKGLVPTKYQRETKPLRLTFQLEGKPPLYVEEIDTNGDGTLDQFQIRPGPAVAVIRTITADSLKDERCKRLIVCVDGVPFCTAQRLWEGGYFREFYPPSRMVSPFPSMTFLSFTEIFRTSKAISYEESYFDRLANKMAGGMHEHLNKVKFAEFYKRFDYQTPGIQGATIYFDPDNVSAEDFNGMKKSFKLLQSRQEVIAYIGGTDGLAHKLGEPGVMRFFKYLDAAFREAFLSSNEPLRMVFFSDHGNNYVPSRRVGLEEALKAHLGIKELDKRIGLQGRASAVVPAYGLVNFAVVYTEDGREDELAQVLARVRGVDIILTTRNGQAVVWSHKGRARILHRPATGTAPEAYKYDIIQGDPLEMAEVVEGLKKAGKLDAEGYATDRDWFEATKEHKYVDAMHRLHEAAINLVQNKANLIVSLDDGYFYGSKLFEAICALKGTHGSLKRESTLGFVMTNYKRLPDYIRSSEMAEALGLGRRR